MFAGLNKKLTALSLKSDQVKTIRDKLAEGSNDMSSGMVEAIKLGTNNQDVQAQMAIQKKMMGAQQKLIEATMEFKHLAKEKKLEADIGI